MQETLGGASSTCHCLRLVPRLHRFQCMDVERWSIYTCISLAVFVNSQLCESFGSARVSSNFRMVYAVTDHASASLIDSNLHVLIVTIPT